MVSLGGRIAEEIIFGDITTGASSDIKKATKTARRMVTRYGMSDNIGVICYDDDDDEVFIGRDLAHAKSHSEAVAGEIDKEVKAIVDECAKEACTYQIQYTREQCDSALKKWVDNYGIEVYEMTAENANLFRQKIQPVYDKFSAYNELIDLLK